MSSTMSSPSSAAPAPVYGENSPGKGPRRDAMSAFEFVSQIIRAAGLSCGLQRTEQGFVLIDPASIAETALLENGLKHAGVKKTRFEGSMEEGYRQQQVKAGRSPFEGYCLSQRQREERDFENNDLSRITITPNVSINPVKVAGYIEIIKETDRRKWDALIDLGDKINARLGTNISYTHENGKQCSVLGSIPKDSPEIAQILKLAFEQRDFSSPAYFRLGTDSDGNFQIEIPDKATFRIAQAAEYIAQDLPDLVNKTSDLIRPEKYVSKILYAVGSNATMETSESGDIVVRNMDASGNCPDINRLIKALNLAGIEQKREDAAASQPGFIFSQKNGESTATITITPPKNLPYPEGKIHFSGIMKQLLTHWFSMGRCKKVHGMIYQQLKTIESLPEFSNQAPLTYEHHGTQSFIGGLPKSRVRIATDVLRESGLAAGADFGIKSQNEDKSLYRLTIPDATEEKLTDAIAKKIKAGIEEKVAALVFPTSIGR